MSKDLSKIHPRFKYSGERSRYVRFPLGGIGSGGFSVSGSGRMVDWSIRNRPNMQSWNGYTHFAIKAESKGKLIDARVLNGPYDENPAGGLGLRPMFDGFGHGAMRQSLVGVPHCEKVDFYGRFPTADLVFSDKKMPAKVRMTAFSPFIPHDDRSSSMPVAMMAFEITNTTKQKLDFTLAGTLANNGVNSGLHNFQQQDGISALVLANADEVKEADRGNLTIATDAENVEHQDYHFRGQWFDDLAVFWKDFAKAGPLPKRRYDKPRKSMHMAKQPEHGTLAARVTLAPGESKVIRFAISWSFPKGDIYWAFRRSPDSPIPPEPTPLWKNYYSTQWADSHASAKEALTTWASLQARTFAFRDALFGSSQPPEITDAASGTLALLRTATVIRLEDGTLWGWEGQHTKDGSCEGSCTHVWNYQQALSHLFPALERSLRDSEWRYNQLPHGGLTFRQKLPLGCAFDVIGPCADGHFGALIKTCREWKLSGDKEWLARNWPYVKKGLEYIWSKENPDRWDPGQTGILSGRQHQTLDMELFGPNSWLGSMYVAALLASADMAEAMGDAQLSAKCRKMAKTGAAYIDKELYNGRYYFQAIDLSDQSILVPFDT
ncbi:MAG: GH116 family glycosyl-hydrolase, partial [Aestuariivirga sp.]